MDKFASQTPEELTTGFAKTKQKKKRREDNIRYIGKWFYGVVISFNTATIPSFQQMLIVIGRFGEMLKVPSPYELSETFLQKEVETKESLKPFKKSCVVSGYALLINT